MSVLKRYKGVRVEPSDKKGYAAGTWYVWKRVNGKIIHKAIPEARTKEQAEMAERKLIEQAFNQKYGVAAESVGFAEFANGPYLRYVRQNNVNLVAKELYIRLLVKRLGRMNLADITPQDCRDAQQYFQTSKGERTDKLSNASVNRIMSTLSKLFSLACEEGILDRSPMQYVRTLKEAAPRSRLLSPDEKTRLCEVVARDPFMYAVFTLAINLPLRKGQILAITKEAVDWERKTLWVIQSKGRAPRMVPLNEMAYRILEDLASKVRSGPLLLQDGRPVKDFKRRWSTALITAGINKKGAKRGENFTLHDLRHELASELIRQNVNPEIVQKLFGHSAMRISQVYMNTDMGQLATAMDTLNGPADITETIQ